MEEELAATAAAAGGVTGSDEIRSLAAAQENHSNASNFNGSNASTASTIRSYWKTQSSYDSAISQTQPPQDQLVSASQRALRTSNNACHFFFKVKYISHLIRKLFLRRSYN